VRHHVVPQGHVWLQGDNLNNSTDSRSYGAVPLALVRGRVFYKMWPPSEMRRI
jgi:mitochondrial inner membrane protease subunit 1